MLGSFPTTPSVPTLASQGKSHVKRSPPASSMILCRSSVKQLHGQGSLSGGSLKSALKSQQAVTPRDCPARTSATVPAASSSAVRPSSTRKRVSEASSRHQDHPINSPESRGANSATDRSEYGEQTVVQEPSALPTGMAVSWLGTSSGPMLSMHKTLAGGPTSLQILQEF